MESCPGPPGFKPSSPRIPGTGIQRVPRGRYFRPGPSFGGLAQEACWWIGRGANTGEFSQVCLKAVQFLNPHTPKIDTELYIDYTAIKKKL